MARYRRVAAQVADLRQATGTPEPSLPLAPTPAPPQPDELESLTKAELVERAEAAGLATSGNKDALIERLRGGSDE